MTLPTWVPPAWMIALAVKPFILVVAFFLIRLVADFVQRVMPDGAIKRFLFISWSI